MMRLNLHSKMIGHLAKLVFRLPAVQRRWAQRFYAVESNDIPWTPLSKPLPTCRVALVTTAGVHLKSDRPFDMSDVRGDPSYRVIPSTSSPANLTITHDYYDHRDADRDINVVFPVDVLSRMQAENRIGPSATNFYSLMGHIEGPYLDRLNKMTAPDLAARLRDDGVDIAIFTPA